MVMGNFFHLSVSFCVVRAGFAVTFRGQSIVRCNYRWCTMPFSRATVTTWRSRVRFAAHFGRTRAKFPGTRRSDSGRRCRSDEVRRWERKGKTGGERSGTKKSPSKFRAICSMALPDYYPGALEEHPPPPPVRLTSLGSSRGEIQIYAPTAPGVFFELMKNESGRAARFHFLLLFFFLHSATHPAFRPKLEAFLNPMAPCRYTTPLGVYCRSCRRVKTSSDRPERY